MNILITGGTGFVGSHLTPRLLERGHGVTVVSSRGKNVDGEREGLRYLQADTTKKGSWQERMAEYDVIVNLAGRTIFNYWSESYKKKMYASRVETTKNIVAALPENANTVILSASAAGFYGDSGDRECDENAPPGDDFLATLSKDWEAAARRGEEKGARVVLMRFGVVLGQGGGAIATMKTPFNLGLGGPIGNGRQYFPWIHLEDLLSAILFLMDASDLEGPFNCTAPGVVRQREFAKALAGELRRPAMMPAPSFIMKTVLGEFGRSLLGGQKTVPRRLQESGFVFRFPELKEALREILHG